MIPTMDTLTRSQRLGYILSLLLLSAGWVFLLSLILEWSAAHWSRPALAFQAAALVIALLLQPGVVLRRLVVYPLILAASIYLWDTTLPPPTLPEGWPRVLIPSLALIGLLIDYTYSVQRVRHVRRRATLSDQPRVALAEAARLLGVPTADLRLLIHKHRAVIGVDLAGTEYLLLDDLYALVLPNKPRWWQLYAWLLMMVGVSLLTMLIGFPASWQTAVHIVWCLLTWGGIAAWLWVNRVALGDEERAQHWSRARASAHAGRTLSLTLVQQHFLDVMERHKRQ